MKTAVEYLVEQLFPKALSQEQYYHIEQAKEMEKEQLKDAWDNGCGYLQENSEQYYNETFKQEEQ
jgi:2-iminoacetate synthase ThiH